jgi:hypothetical protein
MAEVHGGVGRLRRAKVAGTVQPSIIVVPNVFREHYTQALLTEDQHAVGEFSSDRAHEPFGETVRLGATRRNPDYLNAHIGQDRIERRCELASTISDKKPKLGDAIAKIHHQVAGMLGGPPAVRVHRRVVAMSRFSETRTSRTWSN